ncbi:MAG: Crp/Fnr family transcriptional regulator [Gammaproteobacteria bacterium]|nr:Crp/Fnr family transcriptional regulator [Gammaproteobacteria bacterium]
MPSNLTEDQIKVIKSGIWFNSLDAETQDILLIEAKIKSIESGTRLFARGEAYDGLYAVIKGSVRITSVSPSGKEGILAIIESPHWFGEIALFDGLERTHDALAELDTILVHIPSWYLEKVLIDKPKLWKDFGRLLSQKMRVVLVNIEESALFPPSSRLARRLLIMSRGYGEHSANPLDICIPQEQLGMMVSLSRQTVNQILRQFERQGVVRLHRGRIEILDSERLQKIIQIDEENY